MVYNVCMSHRLPVELWLLGHFLRSPHHSPHSGSHCFVNSEELLTNHCGVQPQNRPECARAARCSCSLAMPASSWLLLCCCAVGRVLGVAHVPHSAAESARALDPHATVCFVRHGQSEWNAARRFTGWTDVELTETGREEASVGGAALAAYGLSFDRAYTSELRRAQETLSLVLHNSAQHSVPTMRHWRLNERHYGALQGRGKQDCVDEFGVEQVRLWRTGFSTPPPLVSAHSPAFPGNDPKYDDVPRALLPRGECLRDTLERVVPFWDEHVVPELRAGRSVLVAAHGHSIRALVKHVDGLSESDVVSLSIPNGIPLVYHLDESLTPIPHAAAHEGDGELRGTYLGDAEKVAAAADWLVPARRSGA